MEANKQIGLSASSRKRNALTQQGRMKILDVKRSSSAANYLLANVEEVIASCHRVGRGLHRALCTGRDAVRATFYS
jgi:hypothetical protein